MNTKFKLRFLAVTLLWSALLSGMQSALIDEDSSDETESASEERDSEQPTRGGVRSFLGAQAAGAGKLLRYGGGAVRSLLVGLAESAQIEDATTVIPRKRDQDEMSALFLRDKGGYEELTRCFPKDVKRLLASILLYDHPLVKLMRKRLGRHCCIRTLGPHMGTVNSAHFNVSGNRIVTADDRTAKIWEVESGERILVLLEYYQVNSAQFNRRGDRIVTASHDKTVKIWDVESGECIHTFLGHIQPVRSAQFNSAGDKIVSASDDGTAKVWDIKLEKCIHTLAGHRSLVRSAQFNGTGDRILTNSSGNTAKLWDVESGECIHTLKDHAYNLTSAQFNRSGDRIVTIYDGRTVKIWDVESGRCIKTFEGHGKTGRSAQLYGAEDRILTATFDRAKIWDTQSGKSIFTFQGHDSSVRSAELNKAGDKIVTASSDGRAKIWDFARLAFLTSWFDRESTLEQALLLNCIYETRITHALMKKRNSKSRLLFDFNTCPHLQEYFDTMPPEVQACLEPFIIKHASIENKTHNSMLT